MRPTQAKEHHAAAPPPVPRLVPVPGSPARTHPAGDAGADGIAWTAGAEVAAGGDGTDGADPLLPPGIGDARAVDADVRGAVGRVLDHVLADRLARARAVDALFADDLAERVAHFTRTGGKRTRSQLLWWSLRACGGGPASLGPALRVGAALELLQTCALVHDDVMDGAQLRRGRPALHAGLRGRYAGMASSRRAGRFAEAAGILAGDLALAWADDLVAETPFDPVPAGAVRRLWSEMRTEMVAGQYLDVHGQLDPAYSLPRSLRAACLKSALYSVERPLSLGAALAGADAATTRALCSAGRCVGMAFQLRDDLDDVFGDPRRTGRPCGSDVREGKPTYLAALARARAEAAGDRHALAVLQRSLGNGDLTGEGLDEVREVLVRTGARTTVETGINRLVERGLRHLDGARLVPEGEVRLRRMLGGVADAAPLDGGPGRGTPHAAEPASGSASPPASASPSTSASTSTSASASAPASASASASGEREARR
ncbi:polyprenyl synthetase family protein [Streptomyces sp. NPDC048514]|uniref:polyprenyl synthetase family protein n=1 Tax=Streptomyces sp. NPDC048514 TaxID=3365564 RepID=UPI00371E8187